MTPAFAITTSKGLSPCQQGFGTGAHAREIGEVQFNAVEAAAARRRGLAHCRGGGPGLVEIARRADDLGAVRRQRPRRLDAEPRGDARHQESPALRSTPDNTSSVVDVAPNVLLIVRTPRLCYVALEPSHHIELGAHLGCPALGSHESIRRASPGDGPLRECLFGGVSHAALRGTT